MSLLRRNRTPETAEPLVADRVDASDPLDGPPDDDAACLSRQPPLTPPAPCDACGSAFFWESPDRQAHCCGCVPIPARRMAVGGWVVAWLDGAAAWWEHEFKAWDPFSHLGEPAADLPSGDF